MDSIEYELFYLVGESKESELPKIREEVERVVKDHGGEFLPAETSEKRTLAYEIKKEKRGTYIARRFTLPGKGDAPFADGAESKKNPLDEITREMRLSPNILRFLILRADDLPELAPIAREDYSMARRSVKESRDRRGVASQAEQMDKVIGAAPTEKDLRQVPEKKASAPVKPVKEVTKEEIDKKLDEVLSGIE